MGAANAALRFAFFARRAWLRPPRKTGAANALPERLAFPRSGKA